MNFEWEPEKEKANHEKHLIAFAAVLPAFLDPARQVVEDRRHDYGETRFNMLAQVEGRVFHITYTLRGAVIRLISARKANDREQRRYGKG